MVKTTMFNLLLILLLVVFPLGQLTRLPLARGEVNIYWHDLIILFLLLTWIIRKIINKEKFYFPKLTRPILGFIVMAGFSLLLSFPYRENREVAIASLYLLRWIFYSGIYFALQDQKKQCNNLTMKQFGNLLIFAGFSAAVLGLMQYIFFPDIRLLTKFGWDPHYYRVVGTYLDPGFTGMIYVLTLILLVLKLWRKDRKKLHILAFLVVYLALALTYARSAYLAYLAGMLVITWHKKAAKFFFTVLLAGILTVFLLPRPGGEGVRLERQSTIWARINNWGQTIKIGFNNPLFGVGFNTYRYVQRDYRFLDKENWQRTHSGAGADSSLLFVFATTGVLGLMSFIWLMSGMVAKKSLVIISSGAALLIHSFFNNSLFYAWIMLWWWILLAINPKSEYRNPKQYQNSKFK